MANNTISQVEVNGTTYDLLDANTLTAVSALKERVTALESSVVTKVYPIGAIFLSVVNTNPQTYITGTTWIAWGSGRVPVGVNTSNANFNTVEKTGGADSHSYKPTGTVSKPTFSGTTATLSHSGGAVQNHTLTTTQIPKINGYFGGRGTAINGQSLGWCDGTIFNEENTTISAACSGYSDATQYIKRIRMAFGGGGAHNHGFTQPTAHSYTPGGSVSQPTFSGDSVTQSHLQQYITCYMWKRTA